MEGTGETDSVAEGRGFELPVPLANESVSPAEREGALEHDPKSLNQKGVFTDVVL